MTSGLIEPGPPGIVDIILSQDADYKAASYRLARAEAALATSALEGRLARRFGDVDRLRERVVAERSLLTAVHLEQRALQDAALAAIDRWIATRSPNNQPGSQL